ncbi:MAG: hypothetical protein H7249_14520 [Chitinophagaceae bacterium]|nr:hypothetical protein [Oligoflexus sp.]
MYKIQLHVWMMIASMLFVQTSCKPIDSASEVKNSTVASTGYPESVPQVLIQTPASVDKPDPPRKLEGFTWKVSGFWKKEEIEVKKMAAAIFVDTTSLFFSTKNDPRTSAEVEKRYEASQLVSLEKLTIGVVNKDPTVVAGGVKAAAARIGPKGNPIDTEPELKSFKQKVKEFALKEKMRVATNMEVNAKDLLVHGTWWANGFILGAKMCGKCKHTVGFYATAGIAKDETTTAKGTATASFDALGQTHWSHAISTSPVAYSKIFTMLDQNIPVYGFPYLQIVIRLGLTLTARIDFGLSVRVPGMLTLTLLPNVSMQAYVGPGAEIGPLTATIEAKLLIFRFGWPISASVGTKPGIGLVYGGLTYDGQEFDAMRGAVIALVKIDIPILFKAIFFAVKVLVENFNVKIPNAKGWKWMHEIWAAKHALIVQKSEGYSGPSFYIVPKANCAAAKNHLATHSQKMKASLVATGDAAEGNEVKTSFEKMISKIETSLCN